MVPDSLFKITIDNKVHYVIADSDINAILKVKDKHNGINKIEIEFLCLEKQIRR